MPPHHRQAFTLAVTPEAKRNLQKFAMHVGRAHRATVTRANERASRPFEVNQYQLPHGFRSHVLFCRYLRRPEASALLSIISKSHQSRVLQPFVDPRKSFCITLVAYGTAGPEKCGIRK